MYTYKSFRHKRFSTKTHFLLVIPFDLNLFWTRELPGALICFRIVFTNKCAPAVQLQLIISIAHSEGSNNLQQCDFNLSERLCSSAFNPH